MNKQEYAQSIGLKERILEEEEQIILRSAYLRVMASALPFIEQNLTEINDYMNREKRLNFWIEIYEALVGKNDEDINEIKKGAQTRLKRNYKPLLKWVTA